MDTIVAVGLFALVLLMGHFLIKLALKGDAMMKWLGVLCASALMVLSSLFVASFFDIASKLG